MKLAKVVAVPGPRIIAALFALLLLTPPGSARSDGGERVRVDLNGVSGRVRDNVLSVLSIAGAVGEPLSESEIRRLHERARGEIHIALQAFGYYRPSITAELRRASSAWVARYHIDPGPPLRLNVVDVKVRGAGADDPAFQKRVEAFPLRTGDVLDHAAYQRGKDAFVDLAARNGHLEARFLVHEIRIDREGYRASIALDFDTGTRYRFGPVTFEPTFLDERLLAGFVTARQGDVLDTRILLAMQTRLGESPYFNRVEVEPRLDLAEGNEVPIHVHLVPSKRRKYGAGVGVATDGGFIGRLSMELRRINRKGHRAEFEVGYSDIEKHIAGQYLIPWVHGRTDLLTVTAGYDDLRPETSRSRTSRVAAGLVRSDGNLRSTYSLNFNRERFEVASDQGVTLFLTAEADWTYVRANDRIDTRRGYLLRLDVQGSDDRVFSDASFVRVEEQVKWIRKAGRRGRVLVRQGGGVLESSSFSDLPASLRFFAGGPRSVRGFAFQSLGPRDDAGLVTGGEALLTASLEYEHAVFEKWRIAAFFDAGNAMRSLTDPIKAGVGLGVRWISPVGPVRVDAAVPADDLDGRARFHLTIGPDL